MPFIYQKNLFTNKNVAQNPHRYETNSIFMQFCTLIFSFWLNGLMPNGVEFQASNESLSFCRSQGKVQIFALPT